MSNRKDAVAIDQDKETRRRVWEVKSGDQIGTFSFQDGEQITGYKRLELGREVLAGAVCQESLSLEVFQVTRLDEIPKRWREEEKPEETEKETEKRATGVGG